MLIKNATYFDGARIIRGDFRNGPSDEEFDATGKFAFPAFYNAHTHLSMTLMRGAGDDDLLHEWLNNVIFPMEQHLTPDLVYKGAMMGLLEMIRTGTSCFNDMYYFTEEVAKATERSGIRGVLGVPIIDLKTPHFDGADGALKEFERLMGLKFSETVQFCAAPHSIYLCPEEMLVKAKEKSLQYGVKFMTHISETRKECADCHRSTGMWPVEYMDSLGLLDENTVLFHAAWLTKMEVKILGDHGCTVVHCPSSNMKLASGGVMPLPELLAAGVNVMLGTDGAASNNSLDMMNEMKTGALLQKSHRWDPTEADATTMLKMATSGSRDIAFVDLNDYRMLPHHNLISNVVYSGGTVTDLIVEDRRIMKDMEILTFDEEKVKAEFVEAASELAEWKK